MAIAVVQSGAVFPVLAAGNITNTQAAFTDTIAAPFRSTDAGAGNNIYVVGAGAGATDLSTGILTFTSSSAVTLSSNAGMTVVNVNYAIGNGMTPGVNAGSTTCSGTFPSNNTAGNALVVIVNWDASKGTPTIADASGNTWKTAGSINDSAGTGYGQVIFYALNVAAGSNKITVTFPSSISGGFTSLNFFELSGVLGFEQYVSNSAASGTAITSGNIVTKNAGDFIVAATGVDHSVTASEAGWTQVPSGAGTNDHLGDIAEYKTEGAAGTYSATATHSATGHWLIGAAVFIPLMLPLYNFPDAAPGRSLPASQQPFSTLPPLPNTTAAAPYKDRVWYPDKAPGPLFPRSALESITLPPKPVAAAAAPTIPWTSYPEMMPRARAPLYDYGGLSFQTLVDDLGVDWCYPDRIVPAPFPRGMLESSSFSPKPVATAAAPFEGYTAFPDRMPQPPSMRALQQDAFAPGLRQERTAPLVDTEYPERLPGPRPPQQMPTASLPLAPERTAPLVDTEYPDRVAGRPYPTAQQQFATEPPLAPERTAPMVVTSYPDSVLGPIEPQQLPVAALPLAPERTSTLAQQVYPDRMPRAQPVAQYQDQAAKPLAPERTAPLVDTEYPDRVPGARAVAYQQPSAAGPVAPIVAVPAPIEGYASYPDTVPGPRQPQHLHWTEISPKPITAAPAPVIGYGAFQDIVPGPRQPLQQAVAAVPLAPERTAPIVDTEYPERIARAQPVAQQQDSAALPRVPERTATLVATFYPDRVDARVYPTIEQAFATEPPLAPERTASMFGVWYPDRILSAPAVAQQQDAAVRSIAPEAPLPSDWRTSYPDQILRPGIPTAAQMYAALYPLPIAAAPAPTRGYTQYPDMLRGPQQPQYLYAAEISPKPVAPSVAPTVAYAWYPDAAMLPAGFRAAYQQFVSTVLAIEAATSLDWANSFPDAIQTRAATTALQQAASMPPLPVVAPVPVQVPASYPNVITRPTLPVAQHVAWTIPLPPPPPPQVPTNPLVWYPNGLVRLQLFALQQSYSVAVGFGLIRPAVAILAPVSRLIQPVASTTLVRPVSPTARLGRP